MEVIFETERLKGVLLEERFLPDVKKFWGNEEVMKHCNGASSEDLLPKTIQAYRRCHLENGLSVYALFEKNLEEVIGAAGFNLSGNIQEVELIYHFNQQAWGKGYATEAATACIELASKHGDVNLIFASASPDNIQSLKILEKIGFENKGLKWFEDTEQEEPYYEIKLKK